MSRKPQRKKVGRPSVDGDRFLFLMPRQMKKDMKLFRQLVKELLEEPVSYSYILREGAYLYMASVRKDLEKAKRGALHAKPRN